MASTVHCILLCTLLFVEAASSVAKTTFRPNGLLLPVTKDSSTRQYLTHINQRTPFVPVRFTIDLGGKFLWVDCNQSYVSSSYRPARCKSAQCSLAGALYCDDFVSCNRGPGCINNTCGHFPFNTVTREAMNGQIGTDVLSIQSTNGKNPGPVVSVSKFVFACASQIILGGLASGVKGMVGLGRSKVALPSQFASSFKFDRKFAICLSASTSSSGVVLFGDGPFVFLPRIDASSSLTYTTLIINPVTDEAVAAKGEPSFEYFIGVKSIKINEKAVSINSSLLSINSKGYGGTKISTVSPYTVMETSIYNAVVKALINNLSNVARVASVAPFGACFSSKNIGSTRVGPAVPQIDLVLQSKSVYWRIFGANSMVQVSKDVLCLGFVDGGINPKTSIVIGGHQIEDNLLQFDLARSRLGFSSTLLFRQTTCANFNFTTSA
ncbi:probable aspartic proteinase GIP2 [Cornus florida]|uniref:probable aspartic proteinase GIP2 n=1 Tax=Cornus florida TaxID=4283 RepID=UPI00289A7434|nr:probable aspartic proteinase GIP2 [Cornus florida]